MDDQQTTCGTVLRSSETSDQHAKHVCTLPPDHDGDHQCSHGTAWPGLVGVRVELAEGEQR